MSSIGFSCIATCFNVFYCRVFVVLAGVLLSVVACGGLAYFIVKGTVGGLLRGRVFLLLSHSDEHGWVDVDARQFLRFQDVDVHLQSPNQMCSPLWSK